MLENLGELFAAMAMARQEFGAFTKSKTATIKSDKGSYGYSYADLSDIIEATAAALAKHGLVVIQEPEVVSDGGRQMVIIHGCIAHKSGGIYQFRSLPVPVVGGTAQSIGSAISYARRYQLSAVLNLAASDDDGKDASEPAAPQQPRKVNEDTGEIVDGDVLFEKPKRPLLSEAQLKELNTVGTKLYGSKEWEEQRPKLVEAVSTGAVTSSKELTSAEADKLIRGIKKRIADAAANAQEAIATVA